MRERFKAARERREMALRRVHKAMAIERGEMTRAAEPWLTPKRAQTIAAVAITLGSGIVGLLKASGALDGR